MIPFDQKMRYAHKRHLMFATDRSVGRGEAVDPRFSGE